MVELTEARIKYMSGDYEGFKVCMIDLLEKLMPEYTDLSETDPGIVILEVLAFFLDILSYRADIVANESILSLSQERQRVIEECSSMGYTLTYKTAAQFYQVFQIAPQVTAKTISAGTQLKVPSANGLEDIFFETDKDLTIPAGCTGLEKDTSGNYLYKVSITQGFTVSSDIIGTGTNVESQQFKCSYSSILLNSLVIKVDEGDGNGLKSWTKVNNFLDSTTTSLNYRVSINEDDELYVIFGDGIAGKIPITVSNGIVANYRVGGGVIGNVTAKSINTLVQSDTAILSTFNPEEAYVEGKDAETINEAKINAPKSLRTLDRAVTLPDFADLALSTSFPLNILKARAFKDDTKANHINLYMLPSDGSTSFTTAQIKEVLSFFDSRKMPNVFISVKDPNLYNLNPVVYVKIPSEYHEKSNDIAQEVKNALISIFAYGNYDFGQSFLSYPVINNKLITAIEEINLIYFETNYVEIDESQIIVLGTPTIIMTEGE